MVLAQSTDPTSLQQACGDDPSFVCQRVLELDRQRRRGPRRPTSCWRRPLTILLILAVAFVANLLVRRAIKRLTNKIADPDAAGPACATSRRRAPAAIVDTGSLSLRSAARAQTLARCCGRSPSALIWAIAVTMILGELGVNLGPLIAGAGIAGVAIGFGAQSLVKDFLSGIFMLVEDQYGVGDIIDVGEATGTVEAVTLRTTRLRDVKGTVWHVPNGTIDRVGNKSQQWARALLDVDVAYGTDVDDAQAVIKAVADELCERARRGGAASSRRPRCGASSSSAPTAIVIRLVVKTRPGDQFPVMRELRRRLSDEFIRRGHRDPVPAAVECLGRAATQGSSHEVAAADDAPSRVARRPHPARDRPQRFEPDAAGALRTGARPARGRARR